ncbi:hypothetical protein HOY82DRAFT_602457 [Tuber indicum]|nr:hypothetical protein HOY82DRAFT_602457 [Tuber indicum]
MDYGSVNSFTPNILDLESTNAFKSNYHCKSAALFASLSPRSQYPPTIPLPPIGDGIVEVLLPELKPAAFHVNHHRLNTDWSAIPPFVSSQYTRGARPGYLTVGKRLIVPVGCNSSSGNFPCRVESGDIRSNQGSQAASPSSVEYDRTDTGVFGDVSSGLSESSFSQPKLDPALVYCVPMFPEITCFTTNEYFIIQHHKAARLIYIVTQASSKFVSRMEASILRLDGIFIYHVGSSVDDVDLDYAS